MHHAYKPRVDPESICSKVLAVRLKPSDYRALARKSAQLGKSPGTLAREILLSGLTQPA